MKTISVLGCGWLGLPLAEKLVSMGYQVKGSTTTPEKIPLLEKSNIIPFHVNCYPQVSGGNSQEFFNADTLFLNIPFTRKLEDPKYYFDQIDAVLGEVEKSNISFVVFAGSTSVYPDREGSAVEDQTFSPETPRAKVLLEAEELVMGSENFEGTVIRFAGMYGGERRIGQFLSGRKGLPNGNGPVNLIHLDDCVGVAAKIIMEDVRGEVFNACSDEHPKRKDIYVHAAQSNQLPLPSFNDDTSVKLKVVSNDKIKSRLGYQFIHPDPMEL